MIRFARLAAGTATLLALVLSLTTQARSAYGPKEVAAAKKAIDGLVEKPGDVALANTIAKDNAIEDIMHLFKLRTKDGFGIGPKAPEIGKDGIEFMVGDLGQDKPKGFTKDVTGKYSADLVQLAKRTKAIAEVTTFYAPKDDKGKKTKAEWKKWNDEMKAGADDLAKAAEAKDADKVKAAATKLNNACVKCHETFRD